MSFNNRGNEAGTLSAAEVIWVQLGTGGDLLLAEGVAPAASAGNGQLYVKAADNNLYFKTSGGVEYQLTPVAGGGTVTTVSVVSANGFAGTVANPATTPAITLSTTVTGIIKGNGTALSAAVADTDYLTPGTAASTYQTKLVNSAGLAAALNDETGTGLSVFNNTPTLTTPLQSSYEDFTGQASPTAPAAGISRLYAQLGVDGIARMAVRSPAGFDLVVFRDSVQRVFNPSGSVLTKGSVVYVTGENSGVPTVGLAQSNASATSNVFGILLADAAASGFSTVQFTGQAENLDTSAFNLGDTLYLSDSVAGGLTSTAPTKPSFTIPIGVVLVKNATTGQIFLNIDGVQALSLSSLSDVTLASPAVNEVLQYNGTNWTNGPQATASAGPGVTFYLSSTDIVPPGVGPQSYDLETLLKSPSGGVETSDSVAVTLGTSPVFLMAHAYEAAGLGGTQIDGGVWKFDDYANVSALGGPVCTIPMTVNKVMTGAGTVTITGTGTSRTATITGGTPFVSGDANANPTLSGWLQTTNGYFPISGFTSSSVVTITTLSTYTNESGSAYKVHRFLFNTPGPTINSTSVALFTINSTQTAFSIDPTDGLSINYFATNTSATSRTVTIYHEGTQHNTFVTTPLVVRHNDLAGLQGGTSNEYYHLTSAEYTGSGTGVFARVTSPTFTTPNIGSATGSVTGNAGTATALATARAIYGNNFDGTAALTQVIASTYGGTGNGFTKFTGPTTSEKTFTLPDASATIATIDATQTLTNKRVTPRTGSTTSSATPTINTDNVDMYLLTAQAADITSFTTNLSGTPTEGQKLWISITGTAARAITWGTSFENGAVTLPTTTVSTTRLDVGFVWNTVTSKWRCMASG